MARSPHGRRASLVVACALGASWPIACTLDGRVLAVTGNPLTYEPDPDGGYLDGGVIDLDVRYIPRPSAGGSSSGGQRGGVAGSQTGRAGTGGESGTGGATVGRDTGSPDAGSCADRNHDGTPDCDASLVANATFDHDTTSWQTEPDVTTEWTVDDARGSSSSGSMIVRNSSQGAPGGWSFGGATQCITATRGATYDLRADTFIPAEQAVGGAGLSVWFFPTENCAGTAASGDKFDAAPTDKVGVWFTVGETTTAPTSARSMLVRLVALKPLDTAEFDALFDRVRITAE